jgi:cell wall assembly regulator SMI1
MLAGFRSPTMAAATTTADCSPHSAGASGQVITMWHDMADRTIKARSFELWFRQYVYAVLAGKYVYSEDFGGLTNVDFA